MCKDCLPAIKIAGPHLPGGLRMAQIAEARCPPYSRGTAETLFCQAHCLVPFNILVVCEAAWITDSIHGRSNRPVSRDNLQQQFIRRNLVRRVLGTLSDIFTRVSPSKSGQYPSEHHHCKRERGNYYRHAKVAMLARI